jgi:Arc/MetJ-type ribon-helix-helix transcriptional regulator
MEDLLLHIRVSKKLKEQMQVLIDSGYFNNQAEVVREGIRSTVIRYKEELQPLGLERIKRR